jgi:hypothetical protein
VKRDGGPPPVCATHCTQKFLHSRKNIVISKKYFLCDDREFFATAEAQYVGQPVKLPLCPSRIFCTCFF